MENIKSIISSSIEVKSKILEDTALLSRIQQAAELCVSALKSDKKILLCGNGGSAGDAQHIAAEFTGRFYKEREPYFAEALHVNTSYLTAVANDYSYDLVYERLIRAKGRAGDVLIGISTSGNSQNVLLAMQRAKELNMLTIGMTGESGGKLTPFADCLLDIPSSDTPRIQEAHILVGHIICELVENKMTKESE